jgi:RNA methyltransferase, TrmH family
LVGRHSALLKQARSCASRKGRDGTGLFLTEGVRAVSELITWAPGSVTSVLVNSAAQDLPGVHGVIAMAAAAGLSSVSLEPEFYDSIAKTDSSQGVIALARQASITVPAMLERKPEFVVVSDHIQDPGNLGTLIRIADAVGADGFIASQGSADIHNTKTVRAAMGSLFHLPYSKDLGINEICSLLSSAGFLLIAADASGTDVHYDIKYTKPLAVIFGNEGAGITPDVLNFATAVRIPMPGSAESLNVGVAAGVMLYEILRQWRCA